MAIFPIIVNHSDLPQGSRALAGPDFLSMCRVFVSYSQPIRFARFDGKSVNCGLPVSELSIPAAGQKDRGSGDENVSLFILILSMCALIDDVA